MSRSNRSVMKKALLGAIVGTILIGVAKALAFPPVFQRMFFIYAMLGVVVFVLLDAPALKPLSGMDALVALVAFYALLSAVYIGGASLLPQNDPGEEKRENVEILKGKREKVGQEIKKRDQRVDQTEGLYSKNQELPAC